VDFLKENAGELTWKQVSQMFPTFFTTLSLMHNSGIVHRAISPDTIYVTAKGELRLCGFSISTVRTVHTELPCEIFHGYAAPEQYTPSGRQGTWTDVYGICAVLYRILTGCKPTDAPSRMQNDNLCAPHEMNPSIPRHVSRVIMRGMSLFAEDRIQTVTELVTQLFEQHTEETAIPMPSETASYRRQSSRHPQNTEHDSFSRYEDQDDYDDYDVENRDNVIDRIKIPIIIGVLVTCVLLVIAIVVLNLLDMGPLSGTGSSTSETTTTAIETSASIVTESVNDSLTETETNGDSYIPALVGKNFETKKEQLSADGWLYLEPTYEYSDEYKAGLIMEQEFEAGTSFTSGATMKVVVSKGPSSIELPDYKGKTLTEYEAELESLGLTNYNTEAVVNYNYSSGQVIELNKAAGEKFDLTGTETLKIYYASNPETTAPPATEAPTEAPATAAPAEQPVTEAAIVTDAVAVEGDEAQGDWD
jgi:serine/threonine-protein kinase